MIVMGSLTFSRRHFPASSTFKTVSYALKSFKVLGRETYTIIFPSPVVVTYCDNIVSNDQLYTILKVLLLLNNVYVIMHSKDIYMKLKYSHACYFLAINSNM